MNCHSNHIAQKFLCTIYYPHMLEGLEFGTGTESPGYANGIYMGVLCRLHVYTGVADIKGVGLADIGLLHYFVDDVG